MSFFFSSAFTLFCEREKLGILGTFAAHVMVTQNFSWDCSLVVQVVEKKNLAKIICAFRLHEL
jgi:hypothetical protein